MKTTTRVIFFSSLGGVLEFYDFIIYALLAHYLSENFFPSHDARLSLILTLATFAIGYIVRPIGGIFFGHQGDMKGRKKPFTLTVMMMALSTLFIGFLPTYASVGIWAPLMLIALRVLQGFSVGGEIPGGITYLSEVAPKNKALVCSLLFFCLIGGIVLGLCSSLLLHHFLTAQQITQFGWRVPFIVGGVLGIVSFLIRRQLVESPSFEKMLKDKEQVEIKLPLKLLLSKYPKQLLAGFFVTGAGASSIMIFFLLLPTFLGKMQHYPIDYVLNSTTLGLLVGCILILLSGYCIDKLNTKLKSWFTISCVLSVLSALYIYDLFDQKVPDLLLPMMIGAVVIGLLWSAIPSILSILFPTGVRYSGIGLVYNVAFASIGGLAPVISLSLIEYSHSLMGPAYYQMIASALGLVGMWVLKGQNLTLNRDKF
ncbi:MFS transporter [Vibrio marisflavi]|uniref:Proline/betaine transporter n=1 Tax=Vibrio marisflavi CECT 7928 TaxID=634439 RepID=A0ABM9A0A9_9VIBR|nr:MFS transporter [Vibrio marisflavi]CAH0536805.1 Proline/betaine transporter [Vibrio marisflavi CECT 7928]